VKGNEVKYWQQVPVEAMSSETDGEEDDQPIMICRAPSWRSDSM